MSGAWEWIYLERARSLRMYMLLVLTAIHVKSSLAPRLWLHSQTSLCDMKSVIATTYSACAHILLLINEEKKQVQDSHKRRQGEAAFTPFGSATPSYWGNFAGRTKTWRNQSSASSKSKTHWALPPNPPPTDKTPLSDDDPWHC